MADKREIPPLSPQALRIIWRQNQEVLAGYRAAPPRDERSTMTLEELERQTVQIGERLDFLDRNPPPPRRRKSWRDLAKPAPPEA